MNRESMSRVLPCNVDNRGDLPPLLLVSQSECTSSISACLGTYAFEKARVKDFDSCY